MRFEAPWVLFGLLLVPLLFLGRAYLAGRHAKRLSRAGDPALFAALTDGHPRFAAVRTAQGILFALGFALTCFALARPQLGMKTEIRRGRGMDVVLAMDLSRSMYARDVVPSRLERAKIELGALLDGIRGDRAGLVGFTSIGLPLCPLTVDHAALRIQLRAADPSDLPRGGTSVASAIRASMKMLEAAGHDGADKAIVVVTDGENHMGDAVLAAKEAKEAGISVHVAGVGSRVGEPIPNIDENGKMHGYIKDGSGKTIISRLEPSALEKVAAAGGGKLALPAGGGGLDLGPIVSHLSTLKKAELEERTVRVYEERFAWALVPAFLLLLAATLVRPTRRLGLPRITFGLLLGAGLSYSPPASAQSFFWRTHPKVREGLDALEEGRAEEASQAFEEAREILGDDPRIAYDRALADAARGELDLAMDGFRATAERAEDPNLRARARLGLGNALRQLKRYGEAAQAYREALLDDPSVDGARRNLELTRRMEEVQAAQPKDQDGENDDSESDEDNQDENGADAGTGDGGGDAGTGDATAGDGSSSGQGSGDGGTDDGDPSDAGSSGQGSPDAGTGDGGGSSGADDGGADAGVPPSGGDAGTEDAGGAGSSAPEPSAPEEDLSRQEAEAILDALQAEEKALERKRLMERFQGRPVEKDW